MCTIVKIQKRHPKNRTMEEIHQNNLRYVEPFHKLLLMEEIRLYNQLRLVLYPIIWL